MSLRIQPTVSFEAAQRAYRLTRAPAHLWQQGLARVAMGQKAEGREELAAATLDALTLLCGPFKARIARLDPPLTAREQQALAQCASR